MHARGASCGADSPLVAEATSSDGRRVVIDAQAWNHVLTRHAAMAGYLDELTATIRQPEHAEPCPVITGRERLYRRGGPKRWLRVVTEFAGDHDRLISAVPQTNGPQTLPR